MKKTYRDYYNEFPEPYKTAALKNTVAQRGEKNLDRRVYDAYISLTTGFIWSETPEGKKYWMDFVKENFPEELKTDLDEKTDR